MRTYGVKVLDPVLRTSQLDWLVVSIQECPDEHAERRLVLAQFRVPHEPWGSQRAYVRPVRVRRSRRRILFRQESGIAM